jgi:hypothetical protein
MTRSRRRHEASFVFAINPSNSLFLQRNSTRIENLRAKTAKFNSQHCARTSQIAQVLARGFYLEGVSRKGAKKEENTSTLNKKTISAWQNG